MPALLGVFISGELTPCGPLVSAPRALCVSPGQARAPREVGGLFCECDCAVDTFMSLNGLPLISVLSCVVELGIVFTSGSIATATTIGGRVMHGGCASAVTVRGWCEAACAEGVEKEREYSSK
jgi:hypothetical protein